MVSLKKKILVKNNCLWLDNICLVPIIGGKVSFAQRVREIFLNNTFDCVAIGLPESFYPFVLKGIKSLPYISVILAREQEGFYHYLPIDPCDGMIEAVRLAMQEEGRTIKFIDREIGDLVKTHAKGLILPDEYAIDKIGFSPYIQAIFSSFIYKNVPRSKKYPDEYSDDSYMQNIQREKEEFIQSKFMASQLQELSLEHQRILFVFSVHHLTDLFHFYKTNFDYAQNGVKPAKLNLYSVHSDSLYALLGEIPYLTYLYEKIKGTLSFEEFEKIEGIKKLLLEARDEYQREFPEEIYRISPQDVQTALQFIRNLCLLKHRLSPDLYELVVAAKGVMGNDFALRLIETAKFYPYLDITPPYPTIKMTERSVCLEQSVFPAYRRVPSLAKEWKKIKLEKKPTKKQKKQWKTCWNPNTVCSWPPEDEIVENFCGYIRKRALKLVGLSQVRVEEFKTTLKDGIHLRETLRHLHLGKIYVKEEPQIQGEVGAVIFIFDLDSDDRDENQNARKYPYKLTWMAEHQNESTLVFYATDYSNDLIGPGIARCFYGGALFIYPPQLIHDVWADPKFAAASDNAERLIMAGLFYSQDRYVALVAKKKPSAFIQNYAKLQQKRLVFLPLSSFSHTTLQKLRYFHVLNGKPARGWADHYIRPIS